MEASEKPQSPLDALEPEIEQGFPPGEPSGEPPGGEQAGEPIDPETIKMVLSIPFDYIAARKGPHWKLSPEEKAALTPLATKVANKHGPAILVRWGDEIALGVMLYIVVSKRVTKDRELAESEPPPAGV